MKLIIKKTIAELMNNLLMNYINAHGSADSIKSFELTQDEFKTFQEEQKFFEIRNNKFMSNQLFMNIPITIKND